MRWPLAIVGVLAVGGCSEYDLPPLTYDTERTVVGTSFDWPVCAGDLRVLDQQVEFVESMLEVRREEPVEIYLYDDVFDLPCKRGLGCYKPDQDFVAAIWDTVDHEIVHAVDRSIDYPSLFWSEGMAGALKIRGTHRNTFVKMGPEDLANDDPGLDYSTAAHFVRFLIETYGMQSVARAVKGEDLQEVFGMSGEALAEQYEAEAPGAYPPMDPCPYPAVPEVEPGVWEQSVEFSCATEDASQFEYAGAGVVRTVELTEPGTYAVTIDGGDGALIVGCQTEILDQLPPLFSNGDLMNEAEASQTAFGKFFDSGVTHELTVTEGLYRFALTSGVDGPATMKLTVRKL